MTSKLVNQHGRALDGGAGLQTGRPEVIVTQREGAKLDRLGKRIIAHWRERRPELVQQLEAAGRKALRTAAIGAQEATYAARAFAEAEGATPQFANDVAERFYAFSRPEDRVKPMLSFDGRHMPVGYLLDLNRFVGDHHTRWRPPKKFLDEMNHPGA